MFETDLPLLLVSTKAILTCTKIECLIINLLKIDNMLIELLLFLWLNFFSWKVGSADILFRAHRFPMTHSQYRQFTIAWVMIFG